MTAAATAVRPRPTLATRWTPMPPMSPSSPKRSISRAPSMSATPPAAAKWRTMSRVPQPGRVAKAVLIGAVPPVMVKSDKNPGGLPIEVFDGFRAALVANRAQFYIDVPTGPFYGFNRPGAKVIAGRHRQLVAPGHDGRHQGPLRLHQGVFGDRLHRRPEEDRRAGAGHAWRRRPDRALRRFRAAVGQAAEERAR